MIWYEMHRSGRKWAGWHDMKWNDRKYKETKGNGRKWQERTGNGRIWGKTNKESQEKSTEIGGYKGNGQEMDWNNTKKSIGIER